LVEALPEFRRPCRHFIERDGPARLLERFPQQLGYAAIRQTKQRDVRGG
jgi:hypothetical protein